jgi:site-specific recombinase XerD
MKTSITELTTAALTAIQEQGYSKYTIAEVHEDFMKIKGLHNHYGKTELDEKVLDEYLAAQTTWFHCNALSKNRYLRKTCTANRLKTFAKSGEWMLVTRRRGSKFVLNNYYDDIMNVLAKQEYRSEATLQNMLRSARKHFAWLIDEGHSDLNSVSAQVIKSFMSSCAKQINNHSLSTLRGCLKSVYRHLYILGYTKDSFDGILSFPIAVNYRIQPAIPQAEVAETLNSINRNTIKGKRDYAIILLGTVVGLRGVDISKLQLSDFDWPNGEIRVTQSKTGKTLALPLTSDIGEAVRDYIINGRPQGKETTLFLRMQPPFTGLRPSAADSTHATYRRAIGLDRRGFHSLRRSVGKNMVTSGVPVTTVAQVLGHSDINSTTPYISLDSIHLKECALDFTGITPNRGDTL